MVNFQNSVTKIFTASWIEVVVLKCRKKIFGRKIAEIVRYLPDQNILAPSQTVVTAGIAPKVCQHLAHKFPTFTQIGSLSAEL